MRLLTFCAGVALIAAGATSNAATTVTFDDLSPGPAGSYVGVPQGYAGLQWHGFGALDSSLVRADSGYRIGMVSPNNVAFNLGGGPAWISRASGFTLHSTYLTRALYLGAGVHTMHVRVQGLVGTNVTYDNTYTISNSAPTLVSFNYVGVERVIFVSSPDSPFAMDDLMVTIAPSEESCTYVASPRSRTHGLGTEMGSVSVSTQAGCEWSISNTNDWITILSPVNNSGSGTVSYAVTATTSERAGVIGIAGQAFTVNQSTPPDDNRQTLTFDDLLPGSIPNGYGGLQWGFLVLDGTMWPNSGYPAAVISPDNIAFNPSGNPAFIRSRSGAPFSPNHRPELRVQGFIRGTLAYENSYIFITNAPMLIDFNYLGVDEVRFTPVQHSQIFPMDNVAVTVSNDTDVDDDGVPDDQDQCPNTPSGEVVNRNGCSIDQLVPCSGPARGGRWRSHGEYVAAVAKVAESFRRAGLITIGERNATVQAAVRSDCGTVIPERRRWPVQRLPVQRR
jgi:hypothetical protein